MEARRHELLDPLRTCLPRGRSPGSRSPVHWQAPPRWSGGCVAARFRSIAPAATAGLSRRTFDHAVLVPLDIDLGQAHVAEIEAVQGLKRYLYVARSTGFNIFDGGGGVELESRGVHGNVQVCAGPLDSTAQSDAGESPVCRSPMRIGSIPAHARHTDTAGAAPIASTAIHV